MVGKLGTDMSHGATLSKGLAEFVRGEHGMPDNHMFGESGPSSDSHLKFLPPFSSQIS